MLSRILSIQFLLAISLLASCTKDKQAKPLPEPDSTAVECDSAKVLYCNKIKPIIDLNCAVSGCHVSGGSGPGDFSTYAGLKTKVDNGTVVQQVFDFMSMPQSPYGPLTTSDTTLLREWINAGAPQK